MPSKFIQAVDLPQGFSSTFRERFWRKVEITDGCWLWTGSSNAGGYGEIQAGRRGMRRVLAHKASWLIHFGEIPIGMNILHDCPGGDNRACIRPEHLWLGTQSENLIDAMQKRYARGIGHWSAKLKLEEVKEIRLQYATGSVTQAELAVRFHVQPNAISRIVNHQRWNFT